MGGYALVSDLYSPVANRRQHKPMQQFGQSELGLMLSMQLAALWLAQLVERKNIINLQVDFLIKPQGWES